MHRYFSLTKPGILLGNVITAGSGFALASRGAIAYFPLTAVLIGLALVMASACVLNNFLDRISDAKMERTKDRLLARGAIPLRSVLIFAACLIIGGLVTLISLTNWLAASIALSGFLVYVVLYTILKHHSVYATQVGSIAGAVPPVVGYAAATNHLDEGALLLFLLVVLWQMPHFFAIAIYRLNDYSAASIPVLPVKRGVHATKKHMVVYIVAFLFAGSLLFARGYVGYPFLITLAALGVTWLWLSLRGFQARQDQVWAKSMFRFSLVTITALSVMIAISIAP